MSLNLLPLLSLEDSQKQKELSKKEIQRMVEEKQQVISDLNSMEKSFSELFKRFEKQKEVLEGYRKVRCCRANNILLRLVSLMIFCKSKESY